MGKVTVSETVSRSVTVDNNVTNNIQSATTRCFQFLEEGRFEEAYVIIEQILNIDPNNTNVHIANFLYQLRLTCLADVADKFQRVDEYKNSVFYKRIMNSSPTNLVQEMNLWISKAETKLNQLNQYKEKLKELTILRNIERKYFDLFCLFGLFSIIGIVSLGAIILDEKFFYFFMVCFVVEIPFLLVSRFLWRRYTIFRKRRKLLESSQSK